MRTLGIGMLGYGFMGKVHTFAHKAIPFYYSPPPASCRLRVVCTSSAATAQAAMAHGGYERCTTDYREVVNAPDVDVVHVCTPNVAHFPALAAAMRAGKHIYVDKPVTATLKEAEDLAALLPAYKGVAQVVCQNRFFPATLRARELVAQGFLGPITHFRGAHLHSGNVDPARPANWKATAAAGGGVIRDLAVHPLDMLYWLVGPFSAVNCVSRIWAARRPSAEKPGTEVVIDVEDAAVLLLRLKDGAFGTVEASKIATGIEDELRFEIHGRYGAMRFNLKQPGFLEIYDGRLPAGHLGGNRGWQQLATLHRYPSPGGKFPDARASVGWIQGHVHCLFSFLKCVVDGTPATPSLADGIYLQHVLEAARRSAETSAWVELKA
ncbi:MAG: Gfo/Idh/MocA family oxidoreductase [Planctomycetota bacterium]|nr:Gfo/Idh/MocA family oxidoreductase [Planctomycetota bacterium]